MPLPRSAATRELKHRRRIDVMVYTRDDDLFEVDALLRDVKTFTTPLGGQARHAGEPIHEMLLRLVVDRRLNVLEAGSESRWVPYPGHCEPVDDAGADIYARLVGLNLLQGFRREVRARVGGTSGCTHLTELTDVLPTAVVQAFAGLVIDPAGQGEERPFQLDRCHALRSDGAAVRLHYPRWYRSAPAAPPSSQPLEKEAP